MKFDFGFLTRRSLLKGMAALPLAAAFSRTEAWSRLEPTPHIEDQDEPTPSLTEGPFYKPQTPKRTSLREKNTKGEPLIVEGRVLGTNGKQVAGALLDFWHCDADGEYDLVGYKLRGHQFAGEDGKFRLETIVPGLYPGRTRHIHVRVQAPNGRILSTQLYFPGESRNERDGIYDKRCLMKIARKAEEQIATFDFVVRV